MLNGNRILAVIPARGGSKGLPRKNIMELHGKPLIAWTIEEAKKSKYIDRLILSSDDTEIIEVARQYGCEVPFIRPAELAGDETPGIMPILHALDALAEAYDYVVVLQPTSPLRIAADIDGCIERCLSGKAPACVSVVHVEKSPYWMFTLDDTLRLSPLLSSETTYVSRQDFPPVYALNGAVYVASVAWLVNAKTFITSETAAYVMPQERSIDIDTELDLQVCSLLINVSATTLSVRCLC